MAINLRMASLVLAGVLLAAGPALAAGGGGSSGGGGGGAARDSNLTKAQDLIGAEQYAEAIPLLKKVVANDTRNADAFNYLGYSHRKLGDTEKALEYYAIALKIEPEHLGANEYMGELYLELGNVAKAEERLAVLDEACFFGCEEYTELKELIEDYKSRQGAS